MRLFARLWRWLTGRPGPSVPVAAERDSSTRIDDVPSEAGERDAVAVWPPPVAGRLAWALFNGAPQGIRSAFGELDARTLRLWLTLAETSYELDREREQLVARHVMLTGRTPEWLPAGEDGSGGLLGFWTDPEDAWPAETPPVPVFVNGNGHAEHGPPARRRRRRRSPQGGWNGDAAA